MFSSHSHIECVLLFDVDEEDTALQYLKDYLGWRIARGRNWCEGCQQKRGEDAPMLSCGGCHVARFCNEREREREMPIPHARMM